MSGKRARRHFSQLSEFERGLIIGMKTAGWLTRRVAVHVDRSECAVRNCWEQWTRQDSSMASRSPDLSPVEHVWDQLKRQMPFCHSVHDLELAHLPQDDIRWLINTMVDRVAECTAA
ncbi:uncharacterized protein TNCV_4139851 [Trichonephila clavipes]|nr:uncharacterized protein TNCV_4139851 [Trichonephila clavipes]